MMRRSLAGRGRWREGSVFFFEKKNQKTFAYGSTLHPEMHERVVAAPDGTGFTITA
jgi:hypothetical protein